MEIINITVKIKIIGFNFFKCKKGKTKNVHLFVLQYMNIYIYTHNWWNFETYNNGRVGKNLYY